MRGNWDLSSLTEVLIPDSLTLSLARVLIEPLFRQERGELDTLLLRISRLCSRKLGGYSLGLCERFLGWRIRRGLSNEEVKRIKGASEGFSLISPPYLLIESYAFGLTSYRVSLTLRPPYELDLESWRSLFSVLRSILDSRMPETGSLTSKFFSEIYAFHEHNMNPLMMRRLWTSLERSLIPERDSISYFLSPLKTLSEPSPFTFGWTPDPSYLSTDGLLVRFFYGAKGKRRHVHATRRKKRRIHRIAVDQALGLKVFLDNQDLWMRDPETCWGALVGMVYLNPEVLTDLWRFTGRRFFNVYSRLLDQFNLRERFENYRKNFWFPFKDEIQIALFLDAVRMLGSSSPQVGRPYHLDDLQLDALKLIIVKSQLDSLLMPWDEVKLLGLANYLCKFLIGHSNALIGISLGANESCVEEFLSSISSRRKRKGLTYKELSSILTPIYGERARNALVKSSSLLAKLRDLGLIEEGVDRRGRRKGRIRRGFEVSFYIPSQSELVSMLSRGLMEQSQQAAEEIMRMVGKHG